MMDDVYSYNPPTSSDPHSSTELSLQYKNNLWDKFQELINKLMVGKQNVKDFQALTKSQADAFEFMGKPLSKTKMLTEDKNL